MSEDAAKREAIAKVYSKAYADSLSDSQVTAIYLRLKAERKL
jgi:hypothetical protein